MRSVRLGEQWEKVGNWTQGEKRRRETRGVVECTLAGLFRCTHPGVGPPQRERLVKPERRRQRRCGGPRPLHRLQLRRVLHSQPLLLRLAGGNGRLVVGSLLAVNLLVLAARLQ
eukprot:1929565-Pyramimonas_sp.AAC.1